MQAASQLRYLGSKFSKTSAQKLPERKVLETQNLAAPAAKKPRSAMVAAATPGWLVTPQGIIMPDPSYKYKGPTSMEEATSSEERSASTYTSASKESDSDESLEIDESYHAPELKPQYLERWIRPSPPLPAATALYLVQHFRTKERRHGAVAEAVNYCQKEECPRDLVNESLMIWLHNLTQCTNWNVIEIELVSRACAAELEDKIEEILRWEQERQAPDDFNIRNASTRVQRLLAAYVKRLCLREEDADEARKYFKSWQKHLHWRSVDDYAPSVYHHYANETRYRQPRSMSPEGPVLASIGERKYVRGRAQPVRRQPKRASKGDAIDPIDLTS